MDGCVIEVVMGEAAIAAAPAVIVSQGIGSCVVLTLYDRERKLGGLAHVMLPESTIIKRDDTPYYCADSAILLLLEKMQRRGARRQRLEAKLAGGASMFSDASGEGIGSLIVASLCRILEQQGIPLKGWDVGGSHGREVEFHLVDGRVKIGSMGRADKEI